MKAIFKDPAGLQLDISQVAREVINFIQADDTRRYKVIVGSDSSLFPDHSADFVTAIVVHRVGNGGRYFWRNVELKNFYNLHDRIIREVLLSLDVAKDILEKLQESKMSSFDFEIHVDVGENGETKKMLQEVMGIVRAHNFEAKTKPDSYAASKVADRHV